MCVWLKKMWNLIKKIVIEIVGRRNNWKKKNKEVKFDGRKRERDELKIKYKRGERERVW